MHLNVNNRSILIFLFFTSFFALFCAYISQYVFGLQPCILCIYQRIPFFLVIFITLFALFNKQDNWQKLAIKLVIILLIFNALLAFYHVGVEQHIFIFDECADMSANITNLEELKKQILQTKAVRCDEPQFILFGISMAGYNIIYCLGIVLISILFYKKIK